MRIGLRTGTKKKNAPACCSWKIFRIRKQLAGGRCRSSWTLPIVGQTCGWGFSVKWMGAPQGRSAWGWCNQTWNGLHGSSIDNDRAIVGVWFLCAESEFSSILQTRIVLIRIKTIFYLNVAFFCRIFLVAFHLRWKGIISIEHFQINLVFSAKL